MMSQVLPLKPIGETVHDIETWTPSSNGADHEFDYIDISSVDRVNKRITSPTRVTCKNAPSRARQLVRASDVLVSTVRPNLNGVAIVPPTLDGATASTGYCVLRANPDELDSRYLFYWVQTPDFIRDMVRKATGASYPAVSDRIVKESLIPLPPLPEQERIADILDKADGIRRKRQEALKTFEALRAALFDRMFSSRLTTAEWTTLDEYLVELRYGTSNKSGDSGYVTLRIPNIVRGIIDLNDLKTVSVSEGELEKLRLADGDMLFVRTNGNPDYVGRCAIFSRDHFEAQGISPDKVIYASYLIRGRLHQDRLRPAFLQALLQTAASRKDVRDKCRTSAGQYNINTKGIGSLRIPRFDINDQITFEERLQSLDPTSQRLTSAQDEADNLFNSLVQRAFKGEL